MTAATGTLAHSAVAESAHDLIGQDTSDTHQLGLSLDDVGGGATKAAPCHLALCHCQGYHASYGPSSSPLKTGWDEGATCQASHPKTGCIDAPSARIIRKNAADKSARGGTGDLKAAVLPMHLASAPGEASGPPFTLSGRAAGAPEC